MVSYIFSKFGMKIGKNFLPVLILLWVMCFPGHLLGQTETVPEKATEIVSNLSLSADSPPVAFQDRIKQLAEDKNMAEEARKQLKEIYEGCLQQANLIIQYEQSYLEFKNEREGAPELLEKVKTELSQPAEDVLPAAAGKPLTEMESQLAQTEAAWTKAKEELAKLENEPKRRSERRTEIPREIAAAKEQIEKINTQVAQPAPAQEMAEFNQGRKILLQITQKAWEKRIKALQEEALSYEARGALVVSRRDLAARKVSQNEKLVQFWQGAVNQEKKLKAEQAVQQAQQAAQAAVHDDPVIKQITAVNSDLAQRQSKLVDQITKTSRQLKSMEKELNDYTTDFVRSQERVRAAGLTDVIGLLLLGKRNDLPDIRVLRKNLSNRVGDISQAQLELIQLDEQWSELADPEKKIAEIMSQVGEKPSAPEREEIALKAKELLRARKNILEALITLYHDYSDNLTDLDIKEGLLVKKVTEYLKYIDENILWLKSTSRLKLSDFTRATEGLSWLISSANWKQFFLTLRSYFELHFVSSLAASLLILFLLLVRPRLSRENKNISRAISDIHTDRFYHTSRAYFYTLLCSLPVPTLLFFLGAPGYSLGVTDTFTLSFSSALRTTSAYYLFLEFLRRSFWADGLADVHFRMAKEPRLLIKKHISRFQTIALPLILLFNIFQEQPEDEWKNSIGRIAFIILMIALSGLLGIILRPAGKGMKTFLDRHRDSWLDRLRYIWYFLCVLLPLALAFVAGAGYYYTAQQLQERLFSSILLVLSVLFVHASLIRWIFVTHKQLALKQALQKAAATAQPESGNDGFGPDLANSSATGTSINNDASKIPEESLLSISNQTKKVLRACMFMAVLVGLWLIWSNVLPALRILNRVELWKTTIDDKEVAITFASLAVALIIIFMTVVIARNVPGLLNILILKRLPLDRGSRFAITTTTRYIIVIIGVVLAFTRIGIGWTKVQWLVAAMTVGLGFGLQEIFANFVSGLIILFERPMRVGDYVTAGDVSGKVTQIKIRSTTIRSWDRKELIVPNKEFITGRLINWTLSDTILRMDFSVGIAYGSNTELAEKTLYQVAAANSLVLKDPKPIVIFKGFGDSSLQFELRLYIPSLDEYLKVWHQINRAIDDEFRRNKIVIAFPQRDLHIHTVPPNPFPIALEEKD